MTLRCALLAAAAVSSAPALAQATDQAKLAPASSTFQGSGNADEDATERNVADIVVTAQKRPESVQSVPISITVVTGDQVARQGLTSVQDLSRTSASLEFTTALLSPGGGGFVRGIGTQSLGAGTSTSSVAVVVDGVVQGNVPIATLLDIDHVEVLKGPQGTLFGSSVSAGVLNISTLRPDPGAVTAKIFGEIAPRALGSEYGRYVLNGSVNLPMSDTSALRIAAQYIRNDGISRDVYNSLDSLNTVAGVRGRFLWEVTDDLTFNLIGDYTRNSIRNDGNFIYRFVPPGGPLEAALARCGIEASPDNTENCSDYDRFSVAKIGGVSGQFDLAIDGVTLTSVTSYRKSRRTMFSDIPSIAAPIMRQTLGVSCGQGNPFGCSPLAYLHPGVRPDRPLDTRESIFSQEVRLASKESSEFQWTIGGYFQRQTFNFHQPSELAAVVPPAVCTGFLKRPVNASGDCLLNTSERFIDSESTDYAVFANGTYNFDSSTRLNAGVRYTHSQVRETISPDITVVTPTFTTLSVPGKGVTFRGALQHDFNRDTMVYATVSTGYKAPQINDQIPTKLVRVSPERPTSYEVGIKNTAFDGRLAVNVNAYYMRISDFQSQSCIPDPKTGVLACAQVNVPHVVSKGLEADVFGALWQGMTVNLSAIYNDAKYPANFLGADGSNLQGRQLNFAPKFKFTASFEQRLPLSDSATLVFGGDATVRAKESMYLSADPIYTVPSATIFGGRVGVELSDKYSVYAFARNIGNKIYPTSLFSTSAFYRGGVWHTLDQNSQRVAGIQLNAKF
ncbi:TonB-dependent receptor [Sphingomonas tabacisoli]|uniref:TonB-dependent receptor n=1 Tax=Sphingomonas tabacisoli TaxID=2249466 RepID=A0ABW4I1G7_9SPHN